MTTLQPKKRSFFERLTGSIHMEEQNIPTSELSMRRKTVPAARRLYDEDFEEEIIEDSIVVESEEPDEPEEAQLAIDLYETNDALIIKTMTAGVKKDDLQISVTRESLTIKGRRDNDTRSYQHHYHEQELYWGAFTRTIDLPEEIDIEQASATEHHGLVTIKLPKFDKKRKATLKIT